MCLNESEAVDILAVLVVPLFDNSVSVLLFWQKSTAFQYYALPIRRLSIKNLTVDKHLWMSCLVMGR